MSLPRILSDPGLLREKKMAELKLAEKTYEAGICRHIPVKKFNDAISISNDALKKYPQDQLRS